MFTARLDKVLDVYKKHTFEEIQLFLHRNLTFSERSEKQLQELADGGDDLMFWKEYKQNRKFTRVSLCIHTVILTFHFRKINRFSLQEMCLLHQEAVACAGWLMWESLDIACLRHIHSSECYSAWPYHRHEQGCLDKERVALKTVNIYFMIRDLTTYNSLYYDSLYTI